MGLDRELLEEIEAAEELLFSVVVLGELRAGFARGTRQESNLRLLNQFLQMPGLSVVDCGMDTASHYASIWSRLREAGTPIPTNDVWIAAPAIEYGAVLATFDRHFLNVADLQLWPELGTA
jgi:tRNA(fMet)-specific endonuclease VapC